MFLLEKSSRKFISFATTCTGTSPCQLLSPFLRKEKRWDHDSEYATFINFIESWKLFTQDYSVMYEYLIVCYISYEYCTTILFV